MPYRRIVLSVGIFIIISAVLILVSLFYVIEKKGVFEAQSHYKLLAKDAEDIAEGMPILFSGFEIGQVDSLSLYDNGEVLIIISIPQHNTKWVRSNSVFTLDKPLIGKPKITLTSSMTSPPLDEKIITRMQIKDGINEIITNIQPVISELQNIVRNVNILTASLSDHNASFQTSLVHLEKFSNRLADSPDLLHTMTGNEQSAKKFHEAIITLDLALEDLRSLVQNTDQGISEIRSDIISPANANMQELQLIFKDINAKLKAIDQTVKVIGQSDKEIAFLKDEMRVWLEEVTELSTRINTMISDDPKENIELP
jgi:phospholipid/cholesterol/gamma-HCH transport system substrate-binding protein